jgi:quercetin dioxygenase-like cupin family protein
MAGKTDRYIVRPRIVGDIAHHDMSRVRRELGSPYVYMEDSLVPEADMVVHVTDIKEVPLDFKPYVEPHEHEVSSFYGIVGELTVEVLLDDEEHEVTGPASVFIPPGVKHAVCPRRGKGQMIVIIRRGNYK